MTMGRSICASVRNGGGNPDSGGCLRAIGLRAIGMRDVPNRLVFCGSAIAWPSAGLGSLLKRCIEVMRADASLDIKPRWPMLFLAVTAEEQALPGSH